MHAMRIVTSSPSPPSSRRRSGINNCINIVNIITTDINTTKQRNAHETAERTQNSGTQTNQRNTQESHHI
eukprot:5631351-Pyramimonas_sp.AAC.1